MIIFLSLSGVSNSLARSILQSRVLELMNHRYDCEANDIQPADLNEAEGRSSRAGRPATLTLYAGRGRLRSIANVMKASGCDGCFPCPRFAKGTRSVSGES
ncbi:uncharacterized protein LOC112345870 [Selaginella moellendorffii]|uniref:uncharacterized protein LOC112345870 n=1 Tax=Selaginella moellendorffii TaxID=88036 RepID=UPI000D1CCA0E|nr:uncharacterized protein LOC112345870 [Selaginella moellendorffii]|eukprot:XP_024529273.1 uncharacterized protein LOC112345870 [Selaginella moellendorffii]